MRVATALAMRVGIRALVKGVEMQLAALVVMAAATATALPMPTNQPQHAAQLFL